MTLRDPISAAQLATSLLLVGSIGACAAPVGGGRPEGGSDRAAAAKADGAGCLFGEAWPSGDELEWTWGDTSTITSSSSPDATTIVQIEHGMRVADHRFSGSWQEAIVEQTDDDELSRTPLAHDGGRRFTAYDFWAGDNRQGFIFAEGGTRVVAAMGDGYFWTCAVSDAEQVVVPSE